ncbi:MAG: response regulator [bacterium]
MEEHNAVLIVDDDRVIREQLCNELSRNYFKTYQAISGEEALDIFDKKDVDILLLDIKLPDTDGLEVLKKIKERDGECQVIVITGYGNQDLAISSLRNGAIDYIEKPVDMEQFKAALGRAQEQLSKKKELSYQETVLVIDDDKDVLKRLQKTLQREDYEVFAATSGEEGLEIVRKNKVEVIVVDYRLGDMEGPQVLKKVREMFEDIEGIIITGYGKEAIAVKALRSGAHDYLTKPVNLDELLFAVENAIEKINLKRNRLYRQRELKLSSQIKEKMHHELEKQIENRTKELERTQAELFQTSKLATLGEMLAGLAHEINQPLGGIELVAGHLRKLKERDALTEENLELGLEDIESSVERMSRVIKHIRTFARQDSLEFQEVSIPETIRAAMSLINEQLRLHEIEVIEDHDDEQPRVDGEPYQLEQVWINIITNARDALDQKGEKLAERREKFSKKLEISTEYLEKENQVRVRFEDNGSGMSGEVLNKMFDPFFTTKEVGESTGLGLSISYGIIEDHGGKFEVKSKKGEGTTVDVYLPLRQETD